MKRISTIAIALAALVAASLAIGAGDHTVVSVTGKAWHKADRGGWQPLGAGVQLAQDAWVRTAQKANVRLVGPDGTMVLIPEGEERQLGKSPKSEEDSEWGVFRILRELFSDETRKRAAASRGAGDSNAPDAKSALYYDQQWQYLIRLERLSQDDLSGLFETASFYGELEQRNRSLALITRAAQDYPDSTGFAAMARQARTEYGRPAKFTTIKIVGGDESVARSGDVLTSGDGLRIRYSSTTESHLYLYLHSLPEGGESSTASIYPGARGGRAVAAGRQFVLPSPDRAFTLDDSVGREFLWAWSCTAPLFDTANLSAARDAVVAVVNSNKGSGAFAEAVRSNAPALCPQSFAYELGHK